MHMSSKLYEIILLHIYDRRDAQMLPDQYISKAKSGFNGYYSQTGLVAESLLINLELAWRQTKACPRRSYTCECVSVFDEPLRAATKGFCFEDGRRRRYNKYE